MDFIYHENKHLPLEKFYQKKKQATQNGINIFITI